MEIYSTYLVVLSSITCTELWDIYVNQGRDYKNAINWHCKCTQGQSTMEKGRKKEKRTITIFNQSFLAVLFLPTNERICNSAWPEINTFTQSSQRRAHLIVIVWAKRFSSWSNNSHPTTIQDGGSRNKVAGIGWCKVYPWVCLYKRAGDWNAVFGSLV